jgi:hypothetical protein
MNKNSKIDKYPKSVYLDKKERIPGLFLMSGMASFRNCKPINISANPIINVPTSLVRSFFVNVNPNPRPTNGNAIALMLTLKPKIVINQAVMVVPIFAPIITLIASVNVSNPALEKLTTISVVAEDDCITEVIKNPVKIPKNLFEVIEARIDLILFPARFKSESLITFIPNKKTPSAPRS